VATREFKLPSRAALITCDDGPHAEVAPRALQRKD